MDAEGIKTRHPFHMWVLGASKKTVLTRTWGRTAVRRGGNNNENKHTNGGGGGGGLKTSRSYVMRRLEGFKSGHPYCDVVFWTLAILHKKTL